MNTRNYKSMRTGKGIKGGNMCERERVGDQLREREIEVDEVKLRERVKENGGNIIRVLRENE